MMNLQRTALFRAAFAALVALWCSASLMGCASSGPAWAPLSLDGLPSAKDHKDHESMLLLWDQRVRYKADPKSGKVVAEVTTHTRTLYFKDQERPVGLSAFFMKPFIKVLDFKARHIKASGKEKTYAFEDTANMMAFDYGSLYSNSRRRVLGINNVRAGSVVESVQKVRFKDMRFFPQGVAFGSHTPAAHIRFEVRAPEGFEIGHQALLRNKPVKFAPEVGEEGAEQVLVWEKRDLEAVEPEKLGPRISYEMTYVTVYLQKWEEKGEVVEGFTNPRELSAWTYEFMAATNEITPAIREHVQTLLADAGDDKRERARILFEWVRDKVNYCAIQIGYGGWRPSPANEVLDLQYGDCKDKSNLLHTMLKVDEIPSRLALLYSHRGMPKPFGLPTVVGNFNHIILIIDLPEGVVIVDPTERALPFDELPFRDQGAQLLPITQEGDDLLVTTTTGPAQNLSRVSLSVKVSQNGDAKGTFEHTRQGVTARSLRLGLIEKPASKHNELAQDHMGLTEAKVTVKTKAGVEPGDKADPVMIKGKVIMGKTMVGQGTTFLVRPSDMVGTIELSMPDKARLMPVVMRGQARHELKVALELPAGLSIAKMPEPVMLDTDFGTYRLEWVDKGEGRVELHRVYERHKSIIPPDEYEALRGFYKTIARAEQKPVVLEREGVEK